MKQWILRLRATDRDTFLTIKNRKKIIETRAATEKYRAIKKGDMLIFKCGPSQLSKRVSKVKIFRSVGAMARTVSFRKIMPNVSSVAEMETVYHRYPGYKRKIKECGIVAFWLAK